MSAKPNTNFVTQWGIPNSGYGDPVYYQSLAKETRPNGSPVRGGEPGIPSYQPQNVSKKPEPPPLIDFYSTSPPPHAREFPAADPHASRMTGSSHIIRLLLVGGVAVMLIVLTIAILFLVDPEPSGGHRSALTTALQASTTTDLPFLVEPGELAPMQVWHQFCFNFTSGLVIGTLERHPTSGSITDYTRGLVFTDTIIDYDVCCRHKQNHLICISRNVASNAVNSLLDGEIAWTSASEEIYVKLIVRTEMLLGVPCWMTGRYLKP